MDVDLLDIFATERHIVIKGLPADGCVFVHSANERDVLEYWHAAFNASLAVSIGQHHIFFVDCGECSVVDGVDFGRLFMWTAHSSPINSAGISSGDAGGATVGAVTGTGAVVS